MPLAGLLALASLAGALVWASSAGAVVLSGVPCKGNASISGSVLVSAPVLGEVCNTAKPRFHHECGTLPVRTGVLIESPLACS